MSFLYLISHPTLHCICFARACLPIREDRAIETVENFINNGNNCLVVYRSLLCFWSKNLAKNLKQDKTFTFKHTTQKSETFNCLKQSILKQELTLSKVKTLSICLLATLCKTVTSLLCSLHEITLGTFDFCSSSLSGLIISQLNYSNNPNESKNYNYLRLHKKQRGRQLEFDLHLNRTCTLTSLSLSWRFEFQSDPLDSGRRRSGRGVRKGDGDGVNPVPTFLN